MTGLAFLVFLIFQVAVTERLDVFQLAAFEPELAHEASRPEVVDVLGHQQVLVEVAVLEADAFGAWQVQRLGWKRDLVARVEQRIHSPAIPAPAPSEFDARRHEYQPVVVQGRFQHDRETLVQAATRLGAGFWVPTPLVTRDGLTVLVNRGYIATERRAGGSWWREEGEVTVRGLLRISEPEGGFLRANRPGDDRWYSRDVAAISRARSLARPAPYFVDAAKDPRATNGPVGGLTVVKFNDNHLQYAITWFALGAMLAGGTVFVFRRERKFGKLPAT